VLHVVFTEAMASKAAALPPEQLQPDLVVDRLVLAELEPHRRCKPQLC
jgi:hypothetical protein